METTAVRSAVAPDRVEEILGQHMLVKGMMPMVLDLERSRGARLYDRRDDRELLDFFGFYASNAVGMNHPKMVEDEDFRQRILTASINKVTNSDVRTAEMARFVRTFNRLAVPDYMKYVFFISGGALAVENALKAAFDWKVRKNYAKGYRREVGHQVLHLDQAFHGRTGYTLSLTNTADRRKTAYFPKFDWPRIVNPKIVFPLDEHLEYVERRERRALAQAKQHFHERRDDIACVILEPIQGEGGDNHFRPEFLQALKDLAHENDALLIYDEVQSGVGITGAFWAHQVIGVRPDIMAFGKKTQVCGILAGDKLDEVDNHVFQVPSRVNSTWGGNLVDMVRFDRILEIIEEDDLVAQAAETGMYLQRRLHELAAACESVSNVRGRGLMCAFDMATVELRNQVLEECYEQGVVVIGCGQRAVRFRSPLTITTDEIDQGIDILESAIQKVEAAYGPGESRETGHGRSIFEGDL